jgi:hypothetical protein
VKRIDEKSASINTPAPISTFEQISILIPLFIATMAIVIRLVALVTSRSLLPAFVISVAIVSGLVVVDRQRASRRPGSFRPAMSKSVTQPSVVSAIAQVIVALVLIRQIGFTLVPRIGSSDFGGHGGLVTWITEHRGIPNSTVWPVGMSNYPNGAHLPAAMLSMITGLPPLETLWILALVAVVGQWPLLVCITRLITPSGAWWTSSLSLIVVVLMFRYTVGIVTFDFFYGQLAGEWLVLAGVAQAVSVLRRGSAKLAVGWVKVAILGLGSILVYPQVSVVMLGAAGVTLAVAPMKRKTRTALFGSVLAAGLVGVAVLRTTVYWSAALIAGSAGESARPNVADVGGPLVAALALVGLGLMAWRVKRARELAPVLGGLAGPLSVVVAMLALRGGFPVRLAVSDYRLVKNFYSLTPFAVIAVTVACDASIRLIHGWIQPIRNGDVPRQIKPSRFGELFGISVVAVVASAAMMLVEYPRIAVRPIYDRDVYRLGRSLPTSIREDELGITGPWVAVNVMRWSGIGPEVTEANPVEFPRSIQWEKWPDKSVTAKYLLVTRQLAPRFSSRPGVVVDRERGNAVLLRRR